MEHFCELILNLEEWFIGPLAQEMSFKRYFLSRFGGTFVQCSETICAILVEGITRNIYVKLF